MRRVHGFTLIELSIVIAIAAVVLGAVLALVNAQIENARIANMRSKMETVRTALVMFVNRHGRLPCPALEWIDSGKEEDQDKYGYEAPNPGTCTGATPTGLAVRGMLPFRNLGLSSEDALDAYGNRFTYYVSTEATGYTGTAIGGAQGQIKLYRTAPIVGGKPPDGNQINACSADPADNSCNARAILVVLSHGVNAFGAFLQSGQRMPYPSSATEIENANADDNLVRASYSENDPVFDDEVLALTPDMLLASLIREGAFPSPRTITEDQLDSARDAVIASIVNNAGVIPNSLPTEFLDGWGKELQYVPNGSTVCGSVPGTKAFDISSYGPNRAPGASPGGVNDDITRVQSVDSPKATVLSHSTDPCP